MFLTKRKGDVTFPVSYTWSKSLSDSSSNTDGLRGLTNKKSDFVSEPAEYRFDVEQSAAQ